MDTAESGASQATEWVIFEAMGHVRVAGRYYVENGLHRVDIPDPAEPERYRTEWYGNAAITGDGEYRLHRALDLRKRLAAWV